MQSVGLRAGFSVQDMIKVGMSGINFSSVMLGSSAAAEPLPRGVDLSFCLACAPSASFCCAPVSTAGGQPADHCAHKPNPH